MKRTSVVCVIRDGAALIVKRGHTAPWMPGKWSLVGGIVDPGESPLDAAKRETKEEVGLALFNIRRVRIFHDDGWEYYVFKGENHTGPVTLDTAENVSYLWVGVDDLPELDFVPFAEDIIREVLGGVRS